MVICNLPHTNHTVWLCCSPHGNPYLTVESDMPDGVPRNVRWACSPQWNMSRYWIGILKSKRWEACRLKQVEKSAIEEAIVLFGGKQHVKMAHAI